VKYKKRCTRLAIDKVYQLLDHGRWFSRVIQWQNEKRQMTMIYKTLHKKLKFEKYDEPHLKQKVKAGAPEG
jgi:hypothetical protein